MNVVSVHPPPWAQTLAVSDWAIRVAENWLDTYAWLPVLPELGEKFPLRGLPYLGSPGWLWPLL